MDPPGKRRLTEEDDDLEAEAIKRQRISDGEEGGGEEGTDAAALPGLAVYKDDDDEEEEGAGRREQWMGQENGRGETIENGGGQVRVRAGDEEVMEALHQKDVSRPPAPVRQQRQVERRRDCPYLDTVNRQVISPPHQFAHEKNLQLDGGNGFSSLVYRDKEISILTLEIMKLYLRVTEMKAKTKSHCV